MIVNGKSLLEVSPIKDMLNTKVKGGQTTHGLGEAGYDIRIKQEIRFLVFDREKPHVMRYDMSEEDVPFMDSLTGRFVIASAIEEFDMPDDLVGIVHDKSTWARRGLSVFNTVIEPGFRGGLTLELVYHGGENLVIPAGAGIAQVIFHRLSEEACYAGKYQGQSSNPEPARFD